MNSFIAFISKWKQINNWLNKRELNIFVIVNLFFLYLVFQTFRMIMELQYPDPIIKIGFISFWAFFFFLLIDLFIIQCLLIEIKNKK